MRPLAVEPIHERVEAHLLLEHVVRGRPCRLGLERKMHALMATVLLGMARRDALEPNTQTQPPHRQLA